MYSKHLTSPTSVEKELQAQDKSMNLPGLSIDDVLPFDQDHFGGLALTEQCLSASRIDRNSNILDIGSGLGGPARYIAWRTGCRVTGVEIQEDRYDFSVRLTKKLCLDKRVAFIHSDVCELDLPINHYTHIISFQTILHIVHKGELLSLMGRLLRANGQIYLTDYCRGTGYRRGVEHELLNTISCPGLLTISEYRTGLENGGIQQLVVENSTQEWAARAKERCDELDRDFFEKVRIHGKEPVTKAVQFSKRVSAIFDRKIITGVRLIGTKFSENQMTMNL
jgi:cyclopropane fatty-acyl-phospholipid synthase-like methyltransferase